MTTKGRQNLRARVINNWCDETVHISRAAELLVESDNERAGAAVRFHSNDTFKDLMVHQGDAEHDTLVTRRFDDCDGIWLMTELESFRNFGSHEPSEKFGMTLGDGIAKGTGNIGCAVAIIALLALVAFFLYLMVTNPAT